MARTTTIPRSGPREGQGAGAQRAPVRPALAASGAYDEEYDGPYEGATDEEIAERPARGRSYEEDRSWRQLGTLGLGIVLGVLLGAGATLLTTPFSGPEAREFLGSRARRVRRDAGDRWENLRDDLEFAARRGRRNVRRSMRHGRWAFEDARHGW